MGMSIASMRDKKLTELLDVRLLHDQLRVVPDGTWDEDGESPDFIIDSGIRRVGIEVTEWHADPRQRAKEAEQETVVAAARKTHQEAGDPALMVRVYWNMFDAVSKPERFKLIDALVAVVRSNTPEPGHGIVLDGSASDDVTLPPHIDRIDIHRYNEDPDVDWMSVRYGMLATITPELVQSEIRKKSELAGGFREVNELWLLIVLGLRNTSSWGELGREALHARYTGAFDRVFVVSYAPRTAHELRMAGAGAPPI